MKERVIYKERKNTNCEKWDGLLEEYGRRDLLPVWVADMDFRVAEAILKRLHACVDHGIFGYSEAKDDCQQSKALAGQWSHLRRGW